MRERTTKPCNIVNDKLKTMEKYKMYLKKIMQNRTNICWVYCKICILNIKVIREHKESDSTAVFEIEYFPTI